MAQFSRRIFLLLLGSVVPGTFRGAAEASTIKKPSPTPTVKKPSPTPTVKKPSPTPTTQKPSASPTTKSASPTSTPSASGKTSPSATPSQSSVLEGVVIAKSNELVLRQTKIFFIKDSFGIPYGYSLTRTTRGVVAFDISCTHAGAPTFLSGGKLLCPAHGSIFDTETGQAVRGPAIAPLKSYPTIEADGEIRILIS